MKDDILDAGGVRDSIKRAEWLYRAIGESIDYGIWVCDADGRNIYASDSFLRLVGLTQEECSGSGWGRVLHPDDRERTLEAWTDCVRTGGTWNIEHRFLGTDGTYHPILARGVPVRASDDRILCWAGINLDISGIRGAEERLRDADRRKDEFLATLAHELRNPLAPMRNAAYILRAKATSDTQLQRVSGIFQRQLDHLSGLINDLLDISRITHDKIELKPEPVSIASLIDYAIETTRPLIESRRHRLSVQATDSNVHVNADAARFTQALSNVLTNAAKYTEPGGSIWVESARDGDDVVIRVRDDGIGMPESLVPQVFDLFLQGDRALDRAQGGLGLGLALVKRLIELHGGTVGARSDGPGKGSEFILRLPAVDVSGSVLADPAATPPADTPTLRVLVVDDNKDGADSTADLLRLQRHVVQTVYSGAAALGAARVFKPEVVFLDIGLPGMDGYEIAKRLREFPETKHTRLIALTGYGQPADRRRSQEAGFDEHVVKPLKFDDLPRLLGSERMTPQRPG